MKKIVIASTAFLALALTNTVSAQYPKITPEVKKQETELIKAAYARSDSAFAIAKPIIDQQAKEGRPYIPWAARPTDLPQAEIPAFPGAEGGGAYSFGGRGGKVITVTSLADSGPGSLRRCTYHCF